MTWWHSSVVQCSSEVEVVWLRCAQQQPIAVNPGIDGADLADLEAHAATRVLAGACAHFHTTAKRTGWRLAADLGEKHADENLVFIFLEVPPLSAGATKH